MTQRSEAPYGWVGASGAYRGQARLHLTRDCIEKRRNPATGKLAKARPATKDEAERKQKCRHCYGD